ncbi:MAG: hypothetical protein H7201_01350 [Candidatus Saccharibacteria bacterium]|nr:hypothetical protein [Microbacteriaceae bacterium]
MAVGIILVLVSAAGYGWVFAVAVTDRVYFIGLSYETNTYTGDYGSQELHTVATLTGPTVTLLGLSAVSLLLLLAVEPLQFATGVLPGDPSFGGARNQVIAPAIIFALGAIAPVGWLIVRAIRSRGSRSAE